MKITASDLKIAGIDSVDKIVYLKIVQQPNIHPYAHIRFTLCEDSEVEQIQKKIKKEPITLYYEIKAGKKKILFTGRCEENVYQASRGEDYVFEIKLNASSVLLENIKKERSFQNVTMTYGEVIEKVVADKKYMILCSHIEKDQAITMPVIQYHENDWDFIKRMASIGHYPLIVDVDKEKTIIHYGLERQECAVEIQKKDYTVGISKRYERIGGLHTGLQASDFIYYQFCSGKDWKIGAKIKWNGQSFYVYKKHVELIGEVLQFQYTIMKKKAFYTPRQYNEYFVGHTILGKVIDTKQETLMLDLCLKDENHLCPNGYYYNWKPETGNLVYCMPQVGSLVSLYFSDNKESSASVINCIRVNGEYSTRMESTQNKRFHTEHDKIMDLDMEQLYFSTSEKEEANFSHMNLIDHLAIEFLTTGKLRIRADEKISIEGNIISFTAYERLRLKGENAYLLADGEVTIDGNNSVLYPHGVSTTYPIIQDGLEETESVESRRNKGYMGTHLGSGLSGIAAAAVTLISIGAPQVAIPAAILSGLATAGSAEWSGKSQIDSMVSAEIETDSSIVAPNERTVYSGNQYFGIGVVTSGLTGASSIAGDMLDREIVKFVVDSIMAGVTQMVINAIEGEELTTDVLDQMVIAAVWNLASAGVEKVAEPLAGAVKGQRIDDDKLGGKYNEIVEAESKVVKERNKNKEITTARNAKEKSIYGNWSKKKLSRNKSGRVASLKREHIEKCIAYANIIKKYNETGTYDEIIDRIQKTLLVSEETVKIGTDELKNTFKWKTIDSISDVLLISPLQISYGNEMQELTNAMEIENLETELEATFNDIEEKVKVEKKLRRGEWTLATGVEGYVEDIYPNGVIFEGKE